MKIALYLFLLLFGVHISACSKAVGENNTAPANFDTVQSPDNRSVQTGESNSSPNPKDVVLFDGKNYIKKSGWKVPSLDDTYVNDKYDGGPEERRTAKGNEVKMTTKQYIYKTPWSYSEHFNFEGRDLDYIKGNLKCSGFFEMRVNGKVFMYTVFMQKVLPPRVSNDDPHEDPNSYQIQDKDGDGIFETLLGDYDEIIVPNWVLK